VFQSEFASRLAKLLVGLFIYGTGVGFCVHAAIGLAPWDVLAQGIAKQTGLSFGVSTIAVSALVLTTWIPLRIKPGLGSLLNAILVGLFADLTMPLMPTLESYWQQLTWLIVGMLLIAFATGMYISCGMGPGPRDGLNTGLAKRFKLPFWQARTAVEITVVMLGFLLGGQVREGTLIFAIAIGYLNQWGLRIFRLAGKDGRL
jgi:uncharacterized membrane protein YczE